MLIPRILKPLIPLESGAWGLLILPLLVGTGLGSGAWILIGCFWMSALSLFLLRTFWIRVLRGSILEPSRSGAILCSVVAALTGGALLWQGRWGLVGMGIGAILWLTLEARFSAAAKRWKSVRQLGDVVMLCALAPAVIYAGAGEVGLRGWLAWAFCSAYFAWRTALVRRRVAELIARNRGAEIKAVGWREVRYSVLFAVVAVFILRLIPV